MQEHRTQASNRLATWKLLAVQLQKQRDRHKRGAAGGAGVEAAAEFEAAARGEAAVCGTEAASGEDAGKPKRSRRIR
jgi:hypothetical protein